MTAKVVNFLYNTIKTTYSIEEYTFLHFVLQKKSKKHEYFSYVTIIIIREV